MMTAWPALQFGSFMAAWVVSLFVDVPWKYVLWGAAVLAELMLVMVRGEQSAQRAMVQFRQRMQRVREQELERGSSHRPREMPELHVVGVEGLALHALASGLAGLIGGTGRFWLLSCAPPTVVFPLVVAGVGQSLADGLRNPPLIWLLTLPLLWQFLYAQRHSQLLGLGTLVPSPVPGD